MHRLELSRTDVTVSRAKGGLNLRYKEEPPPFLKGRETKMGQLSDGSFDGSGTGVFSGGGQSRWVHCLYSFAIHGGAEGDIVIGHVPKGSTVIGGYLQVDDAVLGVGASVALQVEGANDIVSAAAIAGAPWSTTGKKAIVPKRNTPESTSVTTTAERDVKAVISGADLTAGIFTLHLEILGA
jgi:hypothetical protein